MQRRYGASALLYCLGLYCGRLFPQVAPVTTVLVCHCGILVSCLVAYVDCSTCSQHFHRQEVDLFCCGSDIVFLFHNLYRPPLTPPLWGELLHRGGVRRVFLCLYFFCLHTPKALPIEGKMPQGRGALFNHNFLSVHDIHTLRGIQHATSHEVVHFG